MTERRSRLRPGWAAIVALVMLLALVPSRSSWAETVEDPTVLERSLYKTLVFEGATNTIDLLLFGSLLGGHLYAGPAFVAVNATAATLLYYGHEVAWGYLGPPAEDYDFRDNLLKGITFRLASSTRAFAIGYGFTGDPIAATSFMVGSAVGETMVYIANEYGWAIYDHTRQPHQSTETGPLVSASFVPAATGVEP